MEADSNASYKEIFGNCMLDVVRSHGFLSSEIYSEKGKTANYCSLVKSNLYDIVTKARTYSELSSIDATNCYDCITYAIALLFFQAFGFLFEADKSMLIAIEEIKYFLWSAYGDSQNFSGSTIELKF